MFKTVIRLDGMMCGMCEVHICSTIRKTVPNAKKVSACRGNTEATFLTEVPVGAGVLEAAIKETGYKCLGIESAFYEKRGLFGWK